MPYLLCEELFLKLTADFFFYKGSHGNFATCRINLRHKQRFRALFYRTPWNGDVTQRVVQKQKVKHIWMQIDPLSQKLITKHQWLVHMGSVILDTSKTVATEMEILFLYTWIMFPSFVATDLEVHFSVLKKGCQYFCLYSVCTSHWCLVMSFWLKVCIYSHTRGVKLGLGLGFMQTSQVLPHWLNQ